MAKLIIIDGNSLLFRAYYATLYNKDPEKGILRTKSGIPTNAVVSFLNMMNKILGEIKKGDYLMVAFDTGKPTFRHEALSTYKANRKPVDEDLIRQFPIAREALKALNIFQFEEEGFEADDIAGTMAKIGSKANIDVIVYTSDRDFLQLIDNKITVNLIRKGLKDVEVMTSDAVIEKYGFTPMQIIDYKGLRGDSSDNLPGIPGVGDKTAVKLIQKYHDFDHIVEAMKNEKSKVAEEIINNQELGRMCRDLAIIKTDIDLPFTLEDVEYEGYTFNSINEFCQKYELISFLNRVNSKWKMASTNQEDFEIIETKTFPHIDSQSHIGIAIDLESEENYYDSQIYGLAIDVDDKHYYMHWNDIAKDKNILDVLKDDQIKKYCYDYKSIKVALESKQIEINGCAFDILIAAYLLDSSMNKDAEAIMNYFGVDLPKKNDTISLFDENSNPSRCAKIAYYSKKLAHRVQTELSKISGLKLYKDLELPLIDTLANMEIEGFPLNADILDEFGKEFKKKADLLASQIYELAGEKFNLSSPKQIGEILYDKLKLTNNKKYSTSIDALKEIAHEHPIIDKILEYRKYFKLLSTYVEGLKPHIHSDGKIHATFNQALTQTGRLSSSNPNLQNISIRDEEGKMIRKAFVYPGDKYEILSLDYSQIELRVLAALCHSENLKNIFIEHKDIHSETAKKIFHLTGEVDEQQRRKAKTVNFGIIYGISDWGLAEQLQISLSEAKELRESFFNTYPEVAEFFFQISSDAAKYNYVSTLFGRRRYLREFNDSNYQVREFARRAAINAPIQGTAADLIKLAMIKCEKILKENHFETKMVLQIHDELIFKVPINEKEMVYPLLKKTMETCMDIDVPLEVNGGFGKDWYSAK